MLLFRYCRFYLGRRTEDDSRQVDRWKKCAGDKGRWRNNLIAKIVRSGCAYDNFNVSPVVRQTLQHWGYKLNKEDFDKYAKKVKVWWYGALFLLPTRWWDVAIISTHISAQDTFYHIYPLFFSESLFYYSMSGFKMRQRWIWWVGEKGRIEGIQFHFKLADVSFVWFVTLLLTGGGQKLKERYYVQSLGNLTWLQSFMPQSRLGLKAETSGPHNTTEKFSELSRNRPLGRNYQVLGVEVFRSEHAHWVWGSKSISFPESSFLLTSG